MVSQSVIMLFKKSQQLKLTMEPTMLP